MRAKCAASSAAQAELEGVLARFAGKADKDYMTQSLVMEEMSGFQLEQPFRFYPTKNFQAEFGCAPSQLSLPIEKFVDIHGDSIEGVLLTESRPYYEVKGFYKSGVNMGHILQESQKQLRAEQTREFRAAYMADTAKTLPKGLHRPQTATSVDEIASLKKKFEEEQAKKKEQEAALANIVPLDSIPEDQKQEAVVESDSDGEVADATGALIMLPSQAAARAKAQKKSAKGSAKGSDSKKPNTAGKGADKKRTLEAFKRIESTSKAPASAAAAASVSDAASVAPSDKASQASSGKAKKNREQYFTKAEEWQSKISTHDVLEGVGLGKEVWGSQQTLLALQRTHPSDSRTVLFQVSVDMWVLAQDLGVLPIPRLVGHTSARCKTWNGFKRARESKKIQILLFFPLVGRTRPISIFGS